MTRIVSFALLVISLSAVAQTPISFTGTITADATLHVPDDFADVQVALTYLADKSIRSDVVVTIQVADGTYTNYDPIDVTHPQGNRIHLLGNTTTPSSCTIEFTGNGVTVKDGNRLGLVDGFTLKGNAGTASGVYAYNGSSITCGENLVVRDFNQGVFSYAGSNIVADGVTSSYNTGNGFYAKSATLTANNATASYNQTSGVVSSNGASVVFANSLSEYNSLYGIQAYWNGTIDGRFATTRNNGHYGFLAQVEAVIYATNSSATGNGYGAALTQTGAMIVQ